MPRIFEGKASVESVVAAKTTLYESTGRLYLMHGGLSGVIFETFHEDQHKVFLVHLPAILGLNEASHKKEMAKKRELVSQDYTIPAYNPVPFFFNNRESAPRELLEVLNGCSLDIYFAKQYSFDNFPKVFAFVQSLSGLTSYNQFDSYIKGKAKKSNLAEIVEKMDSEERLERLCSEKRSSCVIS